MKFVMQSFMIIVSIVIFSGIAHAQAGTSAVPFLLISPNSRAGGMGEAGTGLADDAASIFWNSGGLGFLKGSEVSITHSNWLPQFHFSDLFYDYINYRMDVPDFGGSVAASITYLNLGKFVQTSEQGPEPIGEFKAFEVAATVAYGTLVTEDLGLGVNLRFINSSLSPFGTGQEKGTGIAYAFSGDIGILYRPKTLIIPYLDLDLSESFSIGANLSNLGPKITYIDEAQADPLPTNLRIGFGLTPYKDEHNSLTLALDFARLLVVRDSTHTDPFYKALITAWTKPSFNNIIRSFNTCFGIEYWYDRTVALRTGYFYEDPSFGNRNFMTFGAGIRYDIYGFDFSYISAKEENSPLAETLRFTLLILWGGTE